MLHVSPIGRGWLLLLGAGLLLWGCGNRWAGRTLQEMATDHPEAFCAALLENGRPGEYSCNDATWTLPQPTRAWVDACIDSLRVKLAEEPECGAWDAGVYLACDDRFSADGCFDEVGDECDGWMECPLYTWDGWVE